MPVLKQIRISGWKSIKEQTIDLTPLTVVIGANGSGKSNLLSFFRLLEAVSLNDVARLISRSGGASSVLHFGPKVTTAVQGEARFQRDQGLENLGFNLSFAGGDKLLIDSEWFTEAKPGLPGNKIIHQAAGGQFPRPWEGGKVPEDEPAARLHKLVSGIRIFHVHDTSETARPRLTGYIEDNNGLQHDAGNLAAVLYLLQERYPSSLRRITAAAQIAIPGFDQFVLEPQRLAPDKVLLNWKQQGSDYLFGPHQLSDGSLRFIALATLLNQPREMLPPVIVIDEPELGLHPASLGLLGGMLRSVSHSSQVIAATQSVALLDEFEVAEVVVAEKRDGASEFQRLDPQALNEWLERYSLSQLWEKNVIGGGPYG